MTTLDARSVPLEIHAQLGLQARVGSSSARLKAAVLFAAILLVACVLRTWNMHATIATSDQAVMAWLLQYNFGVYWILGYDYGPVLPLIARTWVELCGRIGLSINEATYRIPLAAASILQVLVTYGLMRRIAVGRGTALLGCMVCALLPTLVTDCHNNTAYTTLWLLNGTIALWATLSYLENRQPAWLLVAGAGLVAHCLSNCYSFALPLTLGYVWWRRFRTLPAQVDAAGKPAQSRSRLLQAFIIGFVLPCIAALGIICALYWWTHEGQIGRLLFKGDCGSTGLQLWQIRDLPHMWARQFGYVFGVFSAAGLIWATLSRAQTGAAYRLLAVWCWASVLPLLLFIDWGRVGYPAAYLIEAAYAGGLLAAVFISAAYRRLQSRGGRAIFACTAALAMAHLAWGSTDALLTDGRQVAWTGVRTGWGSIKPESGIKAAGWYVRQYVPMSAIIMATHSNTGMEVSVAEYYLNRAVLADFDLRPAMIEPLVRTMQDDIGVLIVEPCWASLADTLPGFQRAATLRNDGEPVRLIYARSSLALPAVDAEASTLNDRYAREFRITKVPQVKPTPAGFESALRKYQTKVRELRAIR